MSSLELPATATEHALRWLRGAIVAGELAPGRRIAQEEIAGRVGLSVAPIREALRVLEQEGQVSYRPRRGYVVSELAVADLVEIYDLRELLEERAVRQALPLLASAGLERAAAAAAECERAASAGDVTAQLESNRRFHFSLLETPDHPHTLRVIRLLWDSTDAYRALYYNSEAERAHALASHRRILEAAGRQDGDLLVAELNAHRKRALTVLRALLG